VSSDEKKFSSAKSTVKGGGKTLTVSETPANDFCEAENRGQLKPRGVKSLHSRKSGMSRRSCLLSGPVQSSPKRALPQGQRGRKRTRPIRWVFSLKNDRWDKVSSASENNEIMVK